MVADPIETIRNSYLFWIALGDIYAGIFCGNDESQIRNCEVGMYCPTPEEKFPCPAGFFCPHKTETPDIICHQCGEGATKLERDNFGYIALTILAAMAVVYFVYNVIKRCNKDFINRLHDLEQRVSFNRLQGYEHRSIDLKNNRSGSLLEMMSKKKKQQELKKIRHKVELINRRLAALEERGALHKSARTFGAIYNSFGASKSHHSGDLDSGRETKFDARRVFDVLDVDSSGHVSFEEFNVILGLNDLELSEFVRRMNELAGYKKHRESVTRPVFVKYFLQVLKETSNLTVSLEEAEEIFDEMVDNGRVKLDEVHMSNFYKSSMSDFLSDIQICDLIKVRISTPFLSKLLPKCSHVQKRFKVIKKMTAPPVSSRRGLSSIIMLGSIASRRPSMRGGPSVRSLGSQGQYRETIMVIGRAAFVEHYPRLLHEVTMEADSPLGDDDFDFESRWNYPGIDICFLELSLLIKVGENAINVVDKVSGRIRAKTMTALMGGSGAGRFHLCEAAFQSFPIGVAKRANPRLLTGKTSLLNALCGRAFYGDVSGSIYVNGNPASIEEHIDTVGFVPQVSI
jgi:polyhydroxyalkanoate synthesis regulator phasin